MKSGSQQWGIGPAIRLPIFEGGKLRANLRGKSADLDAAIKLAYREAFTRFPTAEESADAKAILAEAPTPTEGMSDLRWILFNSHEFRFVP